MHFQLLSMSRQSINLIRRVALLVAQYQYTVTHLANLSEIKVVRVHNTKLCTDGRESSTSANVVFILAAKIE